VRSNKGSAGCVAVMPVDQLGGFSQHWPAFEQLLNGTYEPKTGEDGWNPDPDAVLVSKAGITTVLGPLVQQAVRQVMKRRWGNRRSPSTAYGFDRVESGTSIRVLPRRRILRKVRRVIDLDWEKIIRIESITTLMGQQIAKRVASTLLLPLIRATHECRGWENRL